ncbi:tRNA-splicing endonuclease protein [Marine Group I thaumarchaeote SCGC AAA799-D07]|nr:tRNA-splicing endonuclease protein [Marine Group I thaumarchaeote SCGC AAA799-D07]
MKGELIENRIIIWNIQDSQQLFTNGYYGKPIGIPKPNPDEINAPLVLDLIEGCYLQEKSKIKIYKNKKRVSVEEVIKICRKEYHNFDKKYLVYKDFREKGYVVNPGIKFGSDFAVYQTGPGIDHAPYLIQVYNRNDTISSTGVVLAGRLSSSVKKKFILAIPSGKTKVNYLGLDWWKA